jgi:hypothetical protein
MFSKNLPWQAKQSILHTSEAFYGECMEACEDFATNFGNKRTGCYITTTQRLMVFF